MDTNIAGKEIEDMLNSNPLELIYSNEDRATYMHYNETRTTPDLLLASRDISEQPDLLLASRDISEHTHRKITEDPGSGHKPVIGSITIGSKSMSRKLPTKLSWNFKKADWSRFTNLLENELNTIPLNFNQHPDKLCTDITNIMVRCAKKTIPRGKTKRYRVLWFKHLEELKKKRDDLRNTADLTGRTEDVKAWRRQSAVLRQAILHAKRTSFDKREFQTSRYNELKARTKEKQWTVALSDIPDWPRIEAVAEFRLRTGHDCLAKHLHRLGVYMYVTYMR
ncbi:unnamed protein product [Rodentolepis nana]|uniref:Endo/exonuclease/phosphatase domain-containing protein n=1 Tax=Rodentolepis nana TaxID=102285 RepID=A0A0R3TCS6_RODNA|nr:unnamed protein product [Rodentolepis nana]